MVNRCQKTLPVGAFKDTRKYETYKTAVENHRTDELRRQKKTHLKRKFGEFVHESKISVFALNYMTTKKYIV